MPDPESYHKQLIGYATWYLTHGHDRSAEAVRERMLLEYPWLSGLQITYAIKEAQRNIAATRLLQQQPGTWRPRGVT